MIDPCPPLKSLPEQRPLYPPARRMDLVDEFHGVAVADPYRWLENLDSAETRAWVGAQHQITSDFLDPIPERNEIRKRLTELWNYERYGLPVKEGGRYFFVRNDGLQNQSALYWMEDLAGPAQVLVDPNELAPDGTIALTAFNVSPDGQRVAYGLNSGGSDWQEWRVRDVDRGHDLPDCLRWVKFSQAAWTHDGRGFFYSRYEEPRAGRPLEEENFYQKLYYHRLGTPQAEDELVHQRSDDREMGFLPTVSQDGRYLIIEVWKGTKSESGLLYKKLDDPESPIVDLLPDFDASYHYIGNEGPRFWFRTDHTAPRGRVVEIDVRNPAQEHWREVIPETKDTLQMVTAVHGALVASYLEDAHSRVRLFDRDGRFVRDLELPGLGAVSGFAGKPDDPETFYCFTGYTMPASVYRYDVATGESRLFRQPRAGFDPEGYETRQVFVSSRDGTRVPMFLTYRKETKPDGSNPVYLYGYGGFNTAVTPCFSVTGLAWMERGGIYAVVNVRGGGEYGEDWHQAGTRLRKQNSFDDLIAAAEWLIANGYTSAGSLAVAGFSNGGLLAAATMIQRPELFGAAVVGVGVLDMLRFPRFTIGWGWVSDYGSPDDPEEFKALYSYSPYHNLKPGAAYPPTLIITADHDDRVVPAHSFKFAAALQHAQGGEGPALIRIETRAGHGSGKPVSKLIEEATDELSFLVKVLGLGE
ncbi:MAG TPA: prolyl oligopeptidase family serine peptidase [Thermoanaerobaculia bacterium]|nr:prolyl oligopeptidase family serine peptidase [Thermoanaerobaculia bacterium]